MISISIALATYNGELYIKEQLDSILNQTIKPTEVVISDDNSTDKTDLLLQEFKAKAPFKVILLKNKGKGFNQNFENALYNTKGDVVFMCDQDDVWLESKIEDILMYFKSHPDKLLVIHDLEFCDSKLNPINQTKIERFKIKKESLNSYVTGMATAVKRRLLDCCMPLSKAVNYDSWIHICADILEVKGVYNKVLAYYRRHESNATKSNILNMPYIMKNHHFTKIKFQPNSYSLFQKEKELIEDLTHYLSEIKENSYFIDTNFTRIESILFIRNRNLFKRMELSENSFFSRLYKAVYLYLRGGYKYYSGFKSMFKDIFIPLQ